MESPTDVVLRSEVLRIQREDDPLPDDDSRVAEGSSVLPHEPPHTANFTVDL